MAPGGADGRILVGAGSPKGQLVMRLFWRVAAALVRSARRGLVRHQPGGARRGRSHRRPGMRRPSPTLIRRTEMRTSAPILRNLRRMVPQVASAKAVSARAMRRNAQTST